MVRALRYSGGSGVTYPDQQRSIGDNPPEDVAPGHQWFSTTENRPYWYDGTRGCWLGLPYQRMFFHDTGGSSPLALKFEITGFTTAPELIGCPLRIDSLITGVEAIFPLSSWTATITFEESTYDGTAAASGTAKDSFSISAANTYTSDSMNGSHFSAGELLTARVTSGTIGACMMWVTLQPYHAA